MEPRKRKITKHGNDRWEVDFGVDSIGRKRRKVVETEAEADKEIADYHKALKARGEWWARLTELERESLQAVCNQIKVAGLTLSRVWEDFKRWKTENAQTAIEAMPYAKAIDKWKVRKLAAGKSEEYVNEAASVLMRSRWTTADQVFEPTTERSHHLVPGANLPDQGLQVALLPVEAPVDHPSQATKLFGFIEHGDDGEVTLQEVGQTAAIWV